MPGNKETGQEVRYALYEVLSRQEKGDPDGEYVG